MKHYKYHPQFSVRISTSNDLRNKLVELASHQMIDYIIETGTYDGLGSTTLIAESFKHSKSLKKFYTCEVDINSFLKARCNLKKYVFVQCLYGLSLLKKQAIDFIKNDPAINEHTNYPEIFIDNTDNLVQFYLNEIQGKLTMQDSKNYFSKFFRILFLSLKFREGLLQKIISTFINKRLFIVLDSAGALGYLEFQTVEKLLKDKEYWLLLDDIHHLKHFRSYSQIKNDARYQILGENYAEGWVLAYKNSY